jgi:hypothetical protein
MITTGTRPLTLARLARDERGLTLPELLVATFLTLTVSATAFSVLQDATRTTEGVMAMSDVNQNLRVALNILIRDLMSTGQGVPIGGIPFPTGGTTVVRPGPPAAEWEFEEDWTTLPAVSPGDGIGQLVNDVDTDAVTLLFKDNRADFPDPVLNLADDASSFTLPNTAAMNAIMDDQSIALQIGDLLMLSNGNGHTLQEITNVEGLTIEMAPTAESNLNQPDAPAGSAGALLNDDGSWPPTTITRIKMISYYIKIPTSSGQITSPHLIRREGWGEERVVAIGITNLQLTWDLVDGVSNPVGVANPGPSEDDPDNANTEHQIRKANVYMAARSLQPSSQTRRHLYSSLSTNVSLRSLALVSRYDLQ